MRKAASFARRDYIAYYLTMGRRGWLLRWFSGTSAVRYQCRIMQLTRAQSRSFTHFTLITRRLAIPPFPIPPQPYLHALDSVSRRRFAYASVRCYPKRS